MNIVILAAGQGKRMRSSLPKVLHPVAGQPMVAHVIAAARQACGDAAGITVVIGHGAAAVQEAFPANPGLRFVLQEPQLGTGHAVMQAVPHLDDATSTLTIGAREGSFPGMLASRTFEVIVVSKDRPVGFSFEPKADRSVRYDGATVEVQAGPRAK